METRYKYGVGPNEIQVLHMQAVVKVLYKQQPD